MSQFHTVLDSIGVAEDGVSPVYGDTFRDDISAAYDADIVGATTSADAVVAELTAQVATLSAELQATQADNYRLMKMIPSAEGAPGEGDPNEEEDGDVADEDIMPEDLFESKSDSDK